MDVGYRSHSSAIQGPWSSMGSKVAFVVLSAFPLWAVAQSTLEWPNALFRAVLALPMGALALFVLPSALAPNTG